MDIFSSSINPKFAFKFSLYSWGSVLLLKNCGSLVTLYFGMKYVNVSEICYKIKMMNEI